MNQRLYRVEIKDAYDDIAGIRNPSQVKRVMQALRDLGTFPYLGRFFDPQDSSQRPRSPVRVLHVGNYGIYYIVDDERAIVHILAVFDQRADPAKLQL